MVDEEKMAFTIAVELLYLRESEQYELYAVIEKGREACRDSVTVEEEWIKKELGEKVCGGKYTEEVVRRKVDKVLISNDGIIKILFKD